MRARGPGKGSDECALYLFANHVRHHQVSPAFSQAGGALGESHCPSAPPPLTNTRPWGHTKVHHVYGPLYSLAVLVQMIAVRGLHEGQQQRVFRVASLSRSASSWTAAAAQCYAHLAAASGPNDQLRILAHAAALFQVRHVCGAGPAGP
jgi:hypothetical protein